MASQLAVRQFRAAAGLPPPEEEGEEGARPFTDDAQYDHGEALARIWTCDLGYDYVRINAEYRT